MSSEACGSPSRTALSDHHVSFECVREWFSHADGVGKGRPKRGQPAWVQENGGSVAGAFRPRGLTLDKDIDST